jgi:tetratricopeptide (TPR) repeat protein
VQDIGRALNVENVLEGSVRRAGDRLRITARLTRVDEGYQLWSNSYTRDLRDVFELQEEIAREIVGALRIRLTGEDSVRVGRPTVDLEAYDAYLRGRFLWHRRTRESLLAARDQFRHAVERAPDFARAHLGLADAYAVLGFYDHLPAQDAFPPARDAALRALELDPTLAQARATFGYVALYYDWDWQAAEREFRTAIQLRPHYSVAHQWLGNYLVAMGRFEEAVASMRRAVELDPLSLIASAALGWAHYHAGDQDRAGAQFRRTLELDPTFHLAYLWSGLSLLEAGDTEAALDALRRARELGANDPALTANLALGLALAGQQPEAARLLARLHERDGREYLPSFEMARAHLANGDEDRALDWLERAMRERSHSIAFLRVDPFLVPLHHHPRFIRLLHQAGLGAAPTAAETSRS